MGRHLSSPTFVGRAEHLDRLLGLLRSEGPAVALVGGEAGVGKTRLMAEVAAHATQGGARCLVGRCVEFGEQILPFAPARAILRELPRQLDGPRLDEVVGPARGDLARLVPDLGPAPADGDPPPPSRLFELILGVLGRLGTTGPLLVVFEDLHWADATSRDLFAFLAHQLWGGVLLAGTYRSDDLPRRHPLRPVLAELQRAIHPEMVALAPLDTSEMQELLSGIMDEPPDAALVSEIQRRSAGNPFYAEELAAAAGAGASVPATLRDLVLARAGKLDRESFRLLCQAAAAGDVEDSAVLATASGLTTDAIEVRLGELAAAGFLAADDTQWRFRHELAREVFESELLPGERARVHRDLATALSERLPEQAGRISRHLWCAGDQPDALTWSIRAADQARKIGAMAETLEAYERALDVWDQVPDAEDRTGLRNGDLLLAAADAAFGAGRFDRAVRLAEDAIEGLANDPLAAGAAWTKLAVYRQMTGGQAGILDATAQALELIPHEPPSTERASALARHGGILAVLGRPAEALAVSREAVAVAGAVGHEQVELYAALTIGLATADLGDPQGLEDMREALARALSANSPFDIGRGYWNLAWALCRFGRYDDVLALAAEGRSVVASLGLSRLMGVGIRLKEMIALQRMGRWDEVERGMSELQDALGADGLRAWDALLAVDYGFVALRRGRVEEVRELFHRAAVKAEGALGQEDLGWIAVGQVEIAAHDRDWAAARDVVEDVLPRMLRDHPQYAAGLVAAGVGAEVARLGAEVAAVSAETRTLVDGWIEDVRRAGKPYEGTAFAPEADAWLEQAEAERSRLFGDPSAERWVQVADDWERQGRPYEAAYASLRAAEALLLEEGPTGPHRAQAVDLLRRAHEIATGLGAVPLLESVEVLARQARVPLDDDVFASPAESDDRPFGLTDRELQVLHLVADGRTNGEIGKALFVTTKTASVHVSNILRKLGAANRVEAAAIAHRVGLIPTEDPPPSPHPV